MIRLQIVKQIERAENQNFHNGAEKLMRSIEGMCVKASAFDADPLIVGVKAGQCIDLNKDEVREIQPSDYLTKSLLTHYSEDAECPLWKKSVLEWCRR